MRQQFTLKERDNETGLDYFLARYYSSTQGRFTSADSIAGSLYNPQSLNLYAYVLNNPPVLNDPDGHAPQPGCNSLPSGSRCLWKGQDPDKSSVPPAHKEGDLFPVASCLGCGSPFGLIADVDAIGLGYQPVSTTSDVLPTSVNLKPVLPPSWVDYVPVASNVRKFLFHYTTHDFEAALLDFSLLSVELGTANVAASAGAARSFATKSGEAIFFSGEGSFQLATHAAASEGGKLVTQTIGGKVLNVIAPRSSPRVWQDTIWQWGSRQFAKGAHGEVRAFIRPPLRPNNTWEHVEYPILRATPFVRIVPR